MPYKPHVTPRIRHSNSMDRPQSTSLCPSTLSSDSEEGYPVIEAFTTPHECRSNQYRTMSKKAKPSKMSGQALVHPFQPIPSRSPPKTPRSETEPSQIAKTGLSRSMPPRSGTPYPFPKHGVRRKLPPDPYASDNSSVDSTSDPTDAQSQRRARSHALSHGPGALGRSLFPSREDRNTPSTRALSQHRNCLLHHTRMLHYLSLARELLYGHNLHSITLLSASPLPPDTQSKWEGKLDDWWLTTSGVLNVAHSRVSADLQSAEKEWEWAVEVIGGDVRREKKALMKVRDEELKPAWIDVNDDGPWPWGAASTMKSDLSKLVRRSSNTVPDDSNWGSGGLSRMASKSGKKRKSMIELHAEKEAYRQDVPGWVAELVSECFGYDQVEEEVWKLELNGKISTGTWKRMYASPAFVKAGKAQTAARENHKSTAEAPEKPGKTLWGMRRRTLSEVTAVSKGSPSQPTSPKGGLEIWKPLPEGACFKGNGADVQVVDAGDGWWILDSIELEEARQALFDQVGEDRRLSLEREEWRAKGWKKGKRWSMMA